MTPEKYLEWLKDGSAERMVLVEVLVNVAGVDTVRYLSSREYVTKPTDSPPNLEYLPVITGDPTITDELSEGGAGGLSAGEIEMSNGDGVLDGWLMDVWRNGWIRVWIGDPAWSRADMHLEFVGIVDDLTVSARDVLKLVLGDKMARMNTTITEVKLGGASPNADVILPLPFGECHNVSPLLMNPATLEYGFGCPVESTFEVRSNGKPVAVTLNNQAGRFTLTTPSYSATITASVQGDNGGAYSPTIASLVRRIATAYGKPADRFTDDDIDLDNFAAFDAGHPQPVGLYVADRTNQAQAIQQLAASVGAQAVMSPTGKLRLIQIALPAPGTPITIGMNQMSSVGVTPMEKLPVVAAVKIGYDRNYTKQTALTTSIPPEHADMYATEWLTETYEDPDVKARYRLTGDPVQIDTCLKRKADAIVEARRRQALGGVPRMKYSVDGEPELMVVELGGPVVLYGDRFDLQVGKEGQVLKRQRHLSSCRVGLEILV